MQRVHLLWIQSCDIRLRLCFLYSLLKVLTTFFSRLTNSDYGNWNWLEHEYHGLCFNSDDSYSVLVLSIRRCTQSEISVSQSKFRETSRVNSGEKWYSEFIDCIGIGSVGKHIIEHILRVINDLETFNSNRQISRTQICRFRAPCLFKMICAVTDWAGPAPGH